jgi:DNA-binding transcriptional MocR family regulator
VERARELYRGRRDAMLAALQTHMPRGVSWTRPSGGLFTWVTLPQAVDAGDLLKRAVTEARVAFVPGGAFFAEGSGRSTLRLSYSLSSEAQIVEGIGRLADLIEAAIPCAA